MRSVAVSLRCVMAYTGSSGEIAYGSTAGVVSNKAAIRFTASSGNPLKCVARALFVDDE